MPEIKRLKKTSEISPNILAVVNYPENKIPARGYIFDIDIEEIYGDESITKEPKKNLVRYIENDTLNNAANHLILRTQKIKDKNIDYVLGFVKGKDWRKENPESNILTRDIVYMEFEKSNGIYRKATPYMVKTGVSEELGSGPRDPTTPIIYGDMLMISGYEELMFRTIPFEDYKNFLEFPKEFGLEYVD